MHTFDAQTSDAFQNNFRNNYGKGNAFHISGGGGGTLRSAVGGGCGDWAGKLLLAQAAAWEQFITKEQLYTVKDLGKTKADFLRWVVYKLANRSTAMKHAS